MNSRSLAIYQGGSVAATAILAAALAALVLFYSL